MDSDIDRDFRTFVAQSTPALFRAAFALTGQQHAAEDLVQAALERVYVRWTRLRDPSSYAKRVMYHEYLSWWRRWRRREVPVAVPPDVSDDDSAARVLLQRALHTALAGLAPRQRAVLVLRYLEDLSEQQVAQLLGCSVKTVSSQSSRALAQLRSACGWLMESKAEEVA